MVKYIMGHLFNDYYPVLLNKGFQSLLEKRPHVPYDNDAPEMTDFEWGKLKDDLKHNVEMAEQAIDNPDDEDVNIINKYSCKVF